MSHLTVEYYGLAKKLLAKAINRQHEQMVICSLEITNEWNNDFVNKLITEVLSELDSTSKQWFMQNFCHLVKS